MKLRFFFSILFVVCFNAISFANNDSIDTLSESNGCSCPLEYLDSLLMNIDSNINPSLSDSIAYTTALINALNNAISIQNNNIDLIAIIVAIIGVLATLLGIGIAVAGFIRFKDLKDDINSYKNSINEDFQKFQASVKGDLQKHKDDVGTANNEYKTSVNDGLKEYKEGIEKVHNEFRTNMERNLKEYKEEVGNNIKEFKASVNDRLKEYKDGMDSGFKEYKARLDEDFQKHKDNTDNNFKKYTDDINISVINMQNEFDEKIKEINLLRDSVGEKAKKLDSIEKKQEYQSQYWQTINQSLFLITNSVVDINHGDDVKAAAIRKNLYNQYYILKAFFPWSDSPIDGTEAAFRYLQANGSEDNIGDLQFIANNDSDDRKKKLAQETIGFIKSRNYQL